MTKELVKKFIDSFNEGKQSLPKTHTETINLQVALNKHGYRKESKWVGWNGAARASQQEAIKEEAVLLHNIIAFLLPNFDIGVDRKDALEAERAAEKEINQIDHKPSSLIFESLIETIGVKN